VRGMTVSWSDREMLDAGAIPDTSAQRSVLRQGLAVINIGIREQPAIFTVAVVSSAVYGVSTVGAAWVVGRVTDQVIAPAFASGVIDGGSLVVAAAAIIAVALAKAVGIVGRRLGAGVMQYRLHASYRQQVTRQYLALPLSWHQRNPAGQLLSNANSDVEAAWFPIAPLPMAVGVLVMVVVAAVAMVLADPVLAAVAAAVFPLLFVANIIYQRRVSPLVSLVQQLRAEVSAIAHESFDGAVVVKTLGREEAETERFGEAVDRLRDATIAAGRVRSIFEPFLDALPNLGVLAVLVVGVSRVTAGQTAAGDLVQVAYLFTLLAFPIRAIGWVLGELPRSVVGWKRIRAVLDAHGEMSYGETELTATGPAKLVVDDVSYRYSSDAAEVLQGMTFDVAPGQTVAVVGPTGAGKSTLASMLVRLVDPSSGTVLLDGTDLREVKRGGVADVVAFVPQAAFLFDDTIRGNVTLGVDFTDDDVWSALRIARADRFVARLPAGLATPVGERGVSLSGGQRQRVVLARALVRRPRLLVLDDATSSVDPAVEAEILTGLREAETVSSVVIVAYRNATIALADEVVYLENGRLIDRGTHDDVVARSPGYHQVVTAYQRDGLPRR
jgi:ATP-binding cassette, subfamily B, bacterial